MIAPMLSPLARDVFLARYGEPTPAQRLAWPAIAEGKSVLVVAPTGSGKTMAAFYAFLAEMAGREPADGDGVEVLYVSPLKALVADVDRNLRAPLAALREEARRRGEPSAAIPVGVRTGDTSGKERAAMRRKPPRILCTTPESLYLLLTSPRSRSVLASVRAVIVDEVHALIASKRGVHLTLSLERLERLTSRPFQRIGLSATVEPLAEAAAWLGGRDDAGTPRPVDILDAGGRKNLDLMVIPAGDPATAGAGSVWPQVARMLVDVIAQHRSTLIFCNSRRLAERMTSLVNAAAGREIAWAHHGSVARERRQNIEERLKAGELPALVATGSLELGIDVGAIDCVVQLQSPKSVARGLQRVGRAGHLVGATAKGRIVGAFRGDLLEAAAIARAMKEHALEPVRSPERCLDVLAQQIVAEVAAGPDSGVVALKDLFAMVRRAHPYRALAWEELLGVVEMLAGRYESGALRDMKPRLDWDRRRGKIGPLPGSRAIATGRPGAIPDRGLYRVELEETRARLGELDEEFVFEARVGEVFVLGTASWRIARILKDRVIVRPAGPGESAKMPFWRGEGLGRAAALGVRVGALTRDIVERLADRDQAAAWLVDTCALDQAAAGLVVEHVRRQVDATGVVPDDRTIVVEQFEDEEGHLRTALLTPLGGRVHHAWAIALAREIRRRTGLEVQFAVTDDGVLFRAPAGEPAERMLALGTWLRAADVAELIAGDLEATALYGGLYRDAAARALILPGAQRGRRLPLWLARQRSADLEQLMRGHPDFPIAREARREALEDVLDVRTLVDTLAAVERGDIRVVPVRRSLPSPFAAQLTFSFTIAFLYEGDAPRLERRARALAAGRELAMELLPPGELEDLLEPDAAVAVEARRQHTAAGTRARTPEELAEILRRLGDLADDEIAPRWEGEGAAARSAIAQLAAFGRAVREPIGGTPRWILDEDLELWRDAGKDGAAGRRARTEIIRRFAAARGPFLASDVTARYAIAPDEVEAVLATLEQERIVARGRFLGQLYQWCDRRNLAEVHRRTMALLRDRGAPATAAQLAAYLLARHRAGAVSAAASLLAGAHVPLETLERDLMMRRVPGYQPALLDAACASGEIVWWLDGTRVVVCPRAEAAAWLPASPAELGADEQAVLAALDSRGAQFAMDLMTSSGLSTVALFHAVWSLARRGLISNDSYDALRRAAALDFEPSSAALEVVNRIDALRRIRHAPPSPWVGRWARLPAPVLDVEARATGQAVTLLRRYGIVGKAVADGEPGTVPWTDLEAALVQLELRGEVVRGYFVDGLGPYQVALAAAVDDLRAPREPGGLELCNACDPANPYGGLAAAAEGRIARLPSNYLVLHGGAPLLLIEGHGKRITPLADASDDLLVAALAKLRALVALPATLRAVRSLQVHRFADDDAAAAEPLFARAGFRRDGARMVMSVLDAEAAARRPATS